MVEDVLLRPATLADLRSVSSLLRESNLVALDDHSQFGEHYVIAENSGGFLFGVAGIEIRGNDGLLRSVAIAPHLRTRGLGTRLIHDRIDYARARRLRALYLLTTTARDYFPRFGFTVIGRTEAPLEIAGTIEWSSACPASSTAMFLKLD